MERSVDGSAVSFVDAHFRTSDPFFVSDLGCGDLGAFYL